MARHFSSQVFRPDFPVSHAWRLRLQGVQLRDPQRFGGQINTKNLRTLTRHGVGQDAATATNIHHLQALQRHKSIDPIQPQGVDLVQGAEFPLLVPPAVRELGELREFGRVNISRRSHGLAFDEAKLEKSCNKKPAEAGSLR
jgi:hypothetical protein